MPSQKKRIRGTTPEIEKRARELRQQMTPAEDRLWKHLRGDQLKGLYFRRQHPVGHFILDFYCATCKLVIEVDGEIHQCRQEEDEARTEVLMSYGYTVIRFKNDEVMNEIESVIHQIEQVATALLHPPSLAPPSLPQDWGRGKKGKGEKGEMIVKRTEHLTCFPPRIGGRRSPSGRSRGAWGSE